MFVVDARPVRIHCAVYVAAEALLPTNPDKGAFRRGQLAVRLADPAKRKQAGGEGVTDLPRGLVAAQLRQYGRTVLAAKVVEAGAV